jgi:hypothetical protein
VTQEQKTATAPALPCDRILSYESCIFSISHNPSEHNLSTSDFFNGSANFGTAIYGATVFCFLSYDWNIVPLSDKVVATEVIVLLEYLAVK